MDRYQCSVCGAEFDNRDVLVGHLREAHPSQQISNFECTACGARFGSVNELVDHVRGAHPVPIVASQ